MLLCRGLAQATQLHDPQLYIQGAGLALLVPLLPYVLEMQALRKLSTAVFGLLMSLEPAVAALLGFVVLSQTLSALQVIGVGCVVAASAGVLKGK